MIVVVIVGHHKVVGVPARMTHVVRAEAIVCFSTCHYVNYLCVIVWKDESQRSEVVGRSVEGALLLEHPVQLVLVAEEASGWKMINQSDSAEVFRLLDIYFQSCVVLSQYFLLTVGL